MIAVTVFLAFGIELEAARVSFSSFMSIHPLLEGSMSLNCVDMERHNSRAAAAMQCIGDPEKRAISRRVTEQGDIKNQVCSCQIRPEKDVLSVEIGSRLLIPAFSFFNRGKNSKYFTTPREWVYSKRHALSKLCRYIFVLFMHSKHWREFHYLIQQFDTMSSVHPAHFTMASVVGWLVYWLIIWFVNQCSFIYPFSAPNFSFRMNYINRMHGTLSGGIVLVDEGKIAKALYADGSSAGQLIEYDTYSGQCLYEPDLCESGITVAFWLKYLSVPAPGNIGYVINSGGSATNTVGISFGITDTQMFIKINLRHSSHRYWAPIFPINTWQLITFVFTLEAGLSLYINGCNAVASRIITAGDYTERDVSKPASDPPSSFRIGGHGDHRAEMLIDHLLIWYELLQPEDIWHHFMQVGKVPNWELTLPPWCICISSLSTHSRCSQLRFNTSVYHGHGFQLCIFSLDASGTLHLFKQRSAFVVVVMMYSESCCVDRDISTVCENNNHATFVLPTHCTHV